ncbi:MAG: PKD domain-containing protein [Bacteroidales bacterium]
MNLRELFRNKLENSEIIPGDSVRDVLMRRLAIKEFMFFNPSRFNIYYLGGIAAAALVSILILTSKPVASKNQNDKTGIENVKLSDSISFVNPQKQIQVEKTKETVSVVSNVAEKKSSKGSKIKSGVKNLDNKVIENKKEIASTNTHDSLKIKAVFPDKISDGNKPVNLQRSINASFDVSISGGCSPLKVKFLNKSTSYDSCHWVFGDGGFSNEKNPEWIFDQEGEYKIILNVFNADGTQAIASSLITVHPRPSTRFEITPEKPVIPDDEIRFMNYSIDAVRYKWEFGDGGISNAFEPDHKYRKYNNYNVRLIAWSQYGCSDSMLVKNAFSGSGCFIDFPNAFIPGSDGPSGGYYSTKSDEAARIFHPATSGVTDYHLKIFSKLGILIFESNDINIGWDGYLKGQLCEPGVYIWKVRGNYKNGEPFVKMGDVTLLRN